MYAREAPLFISWEGKKRNKKEKEKWLLTTADA